MKPDSINEESLTNCGCTLRNELMTTYFYNASGSKFLINVVFEHDKISHLSIIVSRLGALPSPRQLVYRSLTWKLQVGEVTGGGVTGWREAVRLCPRP